MPSCWNGLIEVNTAYLRCAIEYIICCRLQHIALWSQIHVVVMFLDLLNLEFAATDPSVQFIIMS